MPTGIGHVLQNKGGVAVSMDFDGTSLCFVNAHLAAHQDMTERRNSDYVEICGGLKGHVGNPKQSLLSQFHHVFWMGDLNYRIEYLGSKNREPTDDVFHAMACFIKDRKYEMFKADDQLTNQIAKGKAFYGFKEGPLLFPPTFKVERQKLLQYKSQRSPAWTDRILWRSAPGFQRDVRQTSYGCSPHITVSDHKPVYTSYLVKTWPRPVSVCDAGQRQIKFRACKARGLVAADIASGSSDPYIHFPRQALLKAHADSQYVSQNVNPDWKDTDLPTLTLARSGIGFVNKGLLMFQIRDSDTVGSDDIIAFGMIGMKELVTNENRWTDFEVQLTGADMGIGATSYAGLPAGSFSGQAKLMLPSVNISVKS